MRVIMKYTSEWETFHSYQSEFTCIRPRQIFTWVKIVFNTLFKQFLGISYNISYFIFVIRTHSSWYMLQESCSDETNESCFVPYFKPKMHWWTFLFAVIWSNNKFTLRMVMNRYFHDISQCKKFYYHIIR